ncbi:hypothetical protein [Micromonospora sp. NPDC003776]
MPGIERLAPTGKQKAVVLAALLVILVVSGAIWRTSRQPPASERVACPIFGSDAGPGFCGNADVHRATVPDDVLRRAQDAAEAIWTAASHGGWCMSPNDQSCARRPPSHRPNGQDVEAARLWLSRTEATAVDARLATEHDPAPIGALLYAAQIGSACVVGYVETVPGGAGRQSVVGLLHDGSCL